MVKPTASFEEREGSKIENEEYPYDIQENPFRHAIPSPDPKVAKVLGGKLWREAKEKLVGLIQRTREYLLNADGDFALATVVGQTGSGKTHLLLNIRASLPQAHYNVFYADLTSYTRNQIGPLLGEIVSHWSEDILRGLKQRTVKRLKRMAERGNRLAEKALLGGTVSKVSFMLKQRNLEEVASKILNGKRSLNFDALKRVDFSSPSFLEFLQEEDVEILKRGFESKELGIKDFKFLIDTLTASNKIGVLLFDELGGVANEERRPLLREIKGLINQRPPIVLLFASTPGGLTDLEEIDPPFTRRVAKPRVRCDINLPRSYEEVFDVVRAYFEEFNAVLSKGDREWLKVIIKELFHQGVKTLGDILPVISSALDNSKGKERITSESVEEALRNTRLGLHAPKSQVGAPMREFLRLSTKFSEAPAEFAKDLKQSIRELAFQAGKLKRISYLHPTSRKIPLKNNGRTEREVNTDIYVENDGTRICLNVYLSKDGYVTPEMAEDLIKITEKGRIEGNEIDKGILLSNTGCSEAIKSYPGVEVCTLEKSEMFDLIYLASNRIQEGPERLQGEIKTFLKKLRILDE